MFVAKSWFCLETESFANASQTAILALPLSCPLRISNTCVSEVGEAYLHLWHVTCYTFHFAVCQWIFCSSGKLPSMAQCCWLDTGPQ